MTLLAALILAGPGGFNKAEQLQWRTVRESSLKAEGGWLSVAGLYWLKPGTVTIGTAANSDFVLPNHGGPAHLGNATLANGHVIVRFEEGSGATVNGHVVRAAELLSDAEGEPDTVKVGSLQITVIQRGKRIGFRLIDPEAPRRKSFAGLRWFPLDPKLCVTADFVPYKRPKPMFITNVIGDVRETTCPGYASFQIGGKKYRLEAEDEGGSYFFNFRDLTGRSLTYPAGRFLNTPPPVKGKIVLDFNHAVNPPCAFTDYATCPLPPAGNDLKVEIRAGELNGHH